MGAVPLLRPAWPWFVLPLLLGALAPVACGGPIELVLPPDKPHDGGSLDSESPAASDGDASDLDALDAAWSPVLVGVTPNPRGDGTPSIGDVIDARLTALAAGSRGIVVRRTPAQLLSDTALNELESEANFYGKAGVAMMFVFAVVDGFASGLEPALSGLSWKDPAVFKAMYGRIDHALARLNGVATYFLIGRDVDIFLASRPQERKAFETFILTLISYVRVHPLAPPNLRLGVGFSFSGVNLPDSSFSVLLKTSDVAACSYLPDLGSDAVGLASDIAADADILVQRALGKPIVVEAIGCPSSGIVGSSDVNQAGFLDAFFSAVSQRRSSFAFVNVEQLHDLAPQRCADRAAFEGQPAVGPWTAYACSLGLFTADSQPRLAWQVFLNGAAAFASP